MHHVRCGVVRDERWQRARRSGSHWEQTAARGGEDCCHGTHTRACTVNTHTHRVQTQHANA